MGVAVWGGVQLGLSLGSPGAALIGWAAVALLLVLVIGHRVGLGGGAGLLVGLMLCGAAAGARDAGWIDSIPAQPSSPVEGTVTRVELRGSRARVDIAPLAHPRHRLRVFLERRPPGVSPGARVRFAGRIRALPPAEMPSGHDPQALGRRHGVAWSARGGIDLRAPGDGPGRVMLAAREAARSRLSASARPYGGAVLTGLLLGDRAAVPDSAIEAFGATGTSHLLAVSGLHVGGLALLVAAAVRRLSGLAGWARPAALGAIVALAIGWGFVALAQWPPSACRAGVMLSLWAGARLLGRRLDPFTGLAWAAIGVLIVSPSSVAGVGFQLSFAAVAALLLFAPGRGLVGALLSAVVAAAATAPIEAWHFGTVAPIGPVANLLLCPLAGLLVPAGLFGLLVAPLAPQALDLVSAGAEGLVALAEALTLLGGRQTVGAWAAPAMAIPIAALAGLFLRRFGLAGLAIGALLTITLAGRPAGLEARVLPVGQGDATLIRAPMGDLLVDAGPAHRGRRLLGMLRRAGVRRLDAVYLTHGHPDHYAGLEALLGQLPIEVVRTNGRRPSGRQWASLRAALRRAEVRVERARPGPVDLGPIEVGGGHLVVLTGGGPSSWSANDSSLTLRLEGAAGSMLLPGDVEAAGEARLAAARPGPVAVTLAPHHGSRTSSGAALLEAVCPGAVVFSVGRHNRHRLPHPAIVRRYRSRAITPYRTDQDGQVIVRLDEGPTIEATHRPRRVVRPSCRGDSAERERADGG